MTLRPPPDDRPLDDLLGMRDLFREEARTILDRLRRRLPELEGQPDPGGLGDVVADGVALKGSGALVGLAVVSRAGVLLVRAAELAAERAPDDPPGATAIIGSLRASLGVLERLVDVCLDDDDTAQHALLAEALERFTPGDRSILRSALDAPDATTRPKTSQGPAGERVASEAVAGLVTALTDLLIAETQLGGVEREIGALVAALDRSDAKDAPTVRQVAEALAARAAPARALARSAAELHRWVRTLDPAATPLETLVLLHVGEGCYALPADDVESVIAVTHAVHLDEVGRATLSLDGAPLMVLDLGRYLGGVARTTPAVAVVVHAGGVRFALLVTRAEPPRLMVVRPLDALLSHHPLSRAATIGARGEVVFVLQTPALLDALRGRIEVPSDSR